MIFPEDIIREKKIKTILTHALNNYKLYEKSLIHEIIKYDYNAKCACGSNTIIMRYGNLHCDTCFDYYISPTQRIEMINHTYYTIRILTMLFVLLLIIVWSIEFLIIIISFIYSIMVLVLWLTTLYLKK